MSKGCMVAAGVVVVLVITVLICGIYGVSVHNREVGLRNTISAKHTDNESEFDNMVKKIGQSAQVTDKQVESLKEIFNEHAKARGGSQSGGSLALWIKESVPNVDTSTFNNLQNIITGSRDRWTMRQKELVDLKREHDNLLDKFPSSMVCGILGRQKISITIVTSTRAKAAMQTGVDDDTEVFQKKDEKK